MDPDSHKIQNHNIFTEYQRRPKYLKTIVLQNLHHNLECLPCKCNTRRSMMTILLTIYLNLKCTYPRSSNDGTIKLYYNQENVTKNTQICHL